MSKKEEGQFVSFKAMLFGQQMRAMREHIGATQKEIGQRIGYSESQIRMLESGKRLPMPDYLPQLDEALRANGALLAIAPDIKYQDYPAWFIEYAEAESTALRVDEYGCYVVPGLLQTEEYARAVVSAHCPALDLDEVERLVAARLLRHELLTRKPAPMLSFVIEEWVLRRPTGGHATMLAQCHRLLDCAKLHNVSIQVMPMDSGPHAGLHGPLILLETAEGQRVGYVEIQSDPTWYTERDKVSALEQRYGNIRAQALNEHDSLSLIQQIARKHEEEAA
ncbi:helix-turn-helix transcriptional regulator [Streptomyces sp. B1866]|uniref:helix-turn-helix domain-containing protein n=1 Tax=Streptomyces sp. B1866 TaxID=3075431 RepID=UPI00288ED1EA|nr:helix-turn-helix transcriptional regulator [Streptomyces sp. B1866]MDT3397605.1 helix-turn-helix transcriptional regulator [Streptomyces sp. B1866]